METVEPGGDFRPEPPQMFQSRREPVKASQLSGSQTSFPCFLLMTAVASGEIDKLQMGSHRIASLLRGIQAVLQQQTGRCAVSSRKDKRGFVESFVQMVLCRRKESQPLSRQTMACGATEPPDSQGKYSSWETALIIIKHVNAPLLSPADHDTFGQVYGWWKKDHDDEKEMDHKLA